MSWKITFYNCTVEENILNWPSKLKARFTRIVNLILEHGPNFGMPITRSMGGGLFEVRVKAKEGIGRIFFCYVLYQEIMVLHSFIKKTEKTPQRELDLARKRLNEVLRYGL